MRLRGRKDESASSIEVGIKQKCKQICKTILWGKIAEETNLNKQGTKCLSNIHHIFISGS